MTVSQVYTVDVNGAPTALVSAMNEITTDVWKEVLVEDVWKIAAVGHVPGPLSTRHQIRDLGSFAFVHCGYSVSEIVLSCRAKLVIATSSRFGRNLS